MSKITSILCALLLLPSMFFTSQISLAEDQPQVDPVEEALSSMSLVEQYCSGVATVDYSIKALRDKGVRQNDVVTLIYDDIMKAFPDDDPTGIRGMVETLTHDVFNYRSFHIDTLLAYHFYSCIEGLSTQQGVVLGKTRLSEHVVEVVSCEAPGASLYPCLMDIFRFEIPKEIREGNLK